MSADAFSDDIQHCLECGMNAHMAKPVDVTELTRLLKIFNYRASSLKIRAAGEAVVLSSPIGFMYTLMVECFYTEYRPLCIGGNPAPAANSYIFLHTLKLIQAC